VTQESPMAQNGPEQFHASFAEAFNSGQVEALLSL
jgi:hypothetical protein